MPISLESALDELYAVEPAKFVETRARLVSELRATKEADAAKALASARRPTRSAWAINQVTRQYPAAIEALARTSATLRELQRKADPNSREDLRFASAEHRAALNEAVNAAIQVAGNTPSDAIRTEIETTFQAASVDPSVAADVRVGRLTAARNAETVFPEVERSNAPAPRVERRAEKPVAKADPALEDAWRAATDLVGNAEAAAAEADALVGELQDALAAAKADSAMKARELRAARDHEGKTKRAFDAGKGR